MGYVPNRNARGRGEVAMWWSEGQVVSRNLSKDKSGKQKKRKKKKPGLSGAVLGKEVTGGEGGENNWEGKRGKQERLLRRAKKRGKKKSKKFLMLDKLNGSRKLKEDRCI